MSVEPDHDRCVLVIEDDDSLRKLVIAALGRSGVAADAARDGAEGIALLDKHAYTAILLDMMMPGTGGLEVIAHLKRRQQPHGVVIVMTAAKERFASKLDESVVSIVIRKPFDLEEVVTLVGSIAETAAKRAKSDTHHAET